MQPGYQPDTVVIGGSTPQMAQATTSPFGATGVITAARPMQMMSFIDAVKNVLINNYAGFEGRASRSEYWWFYLFYFMGIVGFTFVDGALFGWDVQDPTWISLIFQLATILPFFAVGVRRMHDHGRSGWWILLPFANVYLLIVEGEEIPNAYGPVPTNIRGNNTGTPYVTNQQPMQQQYQQPMQQQYQQPMQQQYQQPMQQQYKKPPF